MMHGGTTRLPKLCVGLLRQLIIVPQCKPRATKLARTHTFVLWLCYRALILPVLHCAMLCCAVQSPYRDQHGEDWSTQNWGRPLTLRREVYDSLSGLWAGSGFDFESYIVHHSQLQDI
jgi:hypothetical protein